MSLAEVYNVQPECLTPQEENIVMVLADVWNKFVELPIEHPCDREEFCEKIHELQRLILARHGRRQLNSVLY